MPPTTLSMGNRQRSHFAALNLLGFFGAETGAASSAYPLLNWRVTLAVCLERTAGLVVIARRDAGVAVRSLDAACDCTLVRAKPN